MNERAIVLGNRKHIQVCW